MLIRILFKRTGQDYLHTFLNIRKGLVLFVNIFMGAFLDKTFWIDFKHLNMILHCISLHQKRRPTQKNASIHFQLNHT